MWKTFAYLAPFGACLAAALAQPPQEKPTKPDKSAAKPADKPAAKPGEKAAQKPAGKSSDSVRFGVPTETEKHIDQAIAKIEALKQFRCDVRQVVEVLGYRFVADGQYAVGPDMKMLFELKMQLTDPDTVGSLKEVCDGRVHWKHQQVIDLPQVIKIDVKKIREVMDNPKFKKELRDEFTRRLGFSGMVPLMQGLRDSQKFDSHEEDSLGEIPVYVLHGTWTDEALAKSTFRGQQLTMANLPQQIPDKSTVWLGQKDGWPYKIRLESSKKGQSSPTVITIEFLRPMIDVDLPESLFTFEPPAGVKVEDLTDSLYRGLNAILQQPEQVQPSGERSKDSPIGISPGSAETGKPKGNPVAPKGDASSKEKANGKQ